MQGETQVDRITRTDAGATPALRRGSDGAPRFGVVLALLMALVVGTSVIAYRQMLAREHQPLRARQLDLVEASVDLLQAEVGGYRSLVDLLKRNLAVRRALDARGDIDTTALQSQFTAYAEAVQSIAQLRWLDADGHERVRIDVDLAGAVRVTADAELQDKSGRYYFSRTMQLDADEVYVSPIDLNVEHGEVEMPINPALRVAVQSGGDGLHDGVFVVNFRCGPVLQRLRALEREGLQVQVLNDRGYWLLSPEPGQEWGWMLGRPGHTLAVLQPALWSRLQSTVHGFSDVLDESMVTATVVPVGAGFRADHRPIRLFVMTSTAPGQLREIRLHALSVVVPVAMLVLLSATILLRRWIGMQREKSELMASLHNEKQSLANANRELTEALTRSRLLQDELVEARKLSSLGMMVAGVAHELNTPTGAAMMSVSTVQNAQRKFEESLVDGVSRAAFDRFLQKSREGTALAMSNLERASAMIRSFRRLAIDRADESVLSFNLAERVDDLVRSLRPRIRKTRAKIDVAVPPHIELHSYPGVVSQILQNLVDNALSHGIGEGREGTISIHASELEDGRVVVIEVTDDGRGVAAGIADRIFDPFVTSGRGTGHTGLGMHLVHQWVNRLLGGSITVTPAPGQGTRVELRIPASSPQPTDDPLEGDPATPE
ncbi:MAG: HAMP domain-containing histidine kinase [Gammaproteobacteria bacterium]|nr:HAMP domain-containing histidine kinase [Gammaproteobacteria bacterium]